MSGKEMLLMILAAVLADNLVFEGFLGLPVVLAGEKNSKKALTAGLWVAAVLLLSQAILWPLNQVLAANQLDYLGDLAAVAVLLVLAAIAGLAVPAGQKELFPLAALNTAALGLSLNTLPQAAGFAAAMLGAAGAALGFLGAMLLFAGVKSRIDEKQVPVTFRGTPILLVAAFIVAMALTAYK